MPYLQNTNWYKHPTKKHLIIVSLVWFAIVFLLFMDKTDMFTKRLPFPKNFFPYLLVLISLTFMTGFYRNYFKKRDGEM